MAEDDVTLGEVGRRLTNVEAALQTQTTLLGKLVASAAADDVRFIHIDDRISRLERWQTWALRLVVAAVAAAVLALVVPTV